MRAASASHTATPIPASPFPILPASGADTVALARPLANWNQAARSLAKDLLENVQDPTCYELH
jgi:hypothetical protein